MIANSIHTYTDRNLQNISRFAKRIAFMIVCPPCVDRLEFASTMGTGDTQLQTLRKSYHPKQITSEPLIAIS